MPLVKLTAIVAGPDYRGQPGEIIEVPHKDAQQLINAQAARPLEQAAEPGEPVPTVGESLGSAAGVTLEVSGSGEAAPPTSTTSSGEPPTEAPAPSKKSRKK